MSNFRVPVIAVEVEIMLTGGDVARGSIYVSTTSSRHAGPTRPIEWINEPHEFFPFLRRDEERPVLLNKRSVLYVTVLSGGCPEDDDAEMSLPGHHVVVTFGRVVLEGDLPIDLPAGQNRVQDLLNRPGEFVSLVSGHREVLVHKRHVQRVAERGALWLAQGGGRTS
jgi:hypothetical protein